MPLSVVTDRASRRRREGIKVALVSALFVVLGLALRDRVPWYATAFFALCLAGGVALNCVANGVLLREKVFEDTCKSDVQKMYIVHALYWRFTGRRFLLLEICSQVSISGKL